MTIILNDGGFIDGKKRFYACVCMEKGSALYHVRVRFYGRTIYHNTYKTQDAAVRAMNRYIKRHANDY